MSGMSNKRLQYVHRGFFVAVTDDLSSTTASSLSDVAMLGIFLSEYSSNLKKQKKKQKKTTLR